MTEAEIVQELKDIRDCIGNFSSSTIESMIDDLIAQIND